MPAQERGKTRHPDREKAPGSRDLLEPVLSQAICRKPQAVSLVSLNSEEYAIIGLRLITVNPGYQPERTPNLALSNPDDLSGQRR